MGIMEDAIDRSRVGEPAPWFYSKTVNNPRYVFDTIAGRVVVLCFFGSLASPAGQRAQHLLAAHRRTFDGEHVLFLGVGNELSEAAQLRSDMPGFAFLHDFDQSVARLFGVAGSDRHESSHSFCPSWIVIDRGLTIRAVIPMRDDGSDGSLMLEAVAELRQASRFGDGHAPIIELPGVFEPALCQRLIDLHQLDGGTESGFMREIDGRTVLVHDRGHKRRRDCVVVDGQLINEMRDRIARRVLPHIKRVFQFEATRMERYLVGCYTSEEQGHFRPHRDNTTRGTAHRRFAISLSLNDGFEGGELCFPEYGARRYRAPPGSAIVFSCSLLHGVTPVSAGRRYVFLPFLYDEAAASVRLANERCLEPAAAPRETLQTG
jgi:predicted 2-oxoglutarate/Fe(II)-dependent dioxygenase YbiX/peroxiredoxin